LNFDLHIRLHAPSFVVHIILIHVRTCPHQLGATANSPWYVFSQSLPTQKSITPALSTMQSSTARPDSTNATTMGSIAQSLRETTHNLLNNRTKAPSLPPISSQYEQASTNYKEAFALFDRRGNGRCAIESLGDLLRACGQNPTLAEISDLQKSVGGDCM